VIQPFEILKDELEQTRLIDTVQTMLEEEEKQ